MTTRVSSEALGLLDAMLGSFEKLEFVGYLTQAGEPVPRTVLQAALKLDDDSMQEVITDLLGAKLIEISGAPVAKVQLGPRAQRDDFRSLMALYAEDRMTVVTALSSIAMHRLRTMVARNFADAFVLKKKHRKDNDG